MYRYEIPSGIGYYNLEILLNFNHFDVEVFYFLYEPHCHSFRGNIDDFHHLIYYNDGKINLSYQGNNHYISPNSLLYFPPHHKHNETTLEENLTKYHIQFSILQKKKKRKRIEKRLPISQFESDEIFHSITQDKMQIVQDPNHLSKDILEKIFVELEAKKFGYLYKLHLLFSELFVNFVRGLNADSYEYTPQISSPTSNSISFIISGYITETYKNISLNQIARTYNMSERTVQRHIKSLHNTTFKKRLNWVRVEAAKDLLIDTSLSIVEISKEVGYKSNSYFDEIFKELEHMTPKEFRKLHQST